MILDSDSRINPRAIRDAKLRTPLHVACQRSDQAAAAVVKFLIESGFDANNGMGDIDGYKPLHLGMMTIPFCFSINRTTDDHSMHINLISVYMITGWLGSCVGE